MALRQRAFGDLAAAQDQLVRTEKLREAQAETGRPGVNTTWFIAFAGREGQRPEVAIAVALENQTSTGGETAAPIARDVLESILRPAGNP